MSADPQTLSGRQEAAKRALDVVVSGVWHQEPVLLDG